MKRKRIKEPFDRQKLKKEVELCFIHNKECIKAESVYALSAVLKEYGHDYTPAQWVGFCECDIRCLKRFRNFYVKWA